MHRTYSQSSQFAKKTSNKENSSFIETCLGSFVVKTDEESITNLLFFDEKLTSLQHQLHNSNSPLLEEAKQQLCAYCSGKLKAFSLPLNPEGTPFQKKVWKELLSIPYGTTVSYGSIATAIGSPRSSRAVGGANNKNPIPLIIPCHRVIGTNGAMVGYAGGIELKKRLLSMEAKLLLM